MTESKSPPPSNQPEVAQPSTPAAAATGAEASPQPQQPQVEAQVQESAPQQQPPATPSEQEPAEQTATESKAETEKTPAPLGSGDEQAVPPADNPEDNKEDDKEDITMGGTEENSGNPAGERPTANGTTDAAAAPGALNELSSFVPPTKKDTSLREFLGQMDEYAPIIPDAVTAHYLTVAGLPPPGPGPNHTPPHLARLLALATQKFIADIAADAYQYSRIRSSNSASSNNPMGSINVTAGLSSAAAGGAGGASTSAAGASGAGGTAASGGGGGGGDGTAKGKSGAAAGLHLGVQRSGFGGGGHGGSQGKTVLTMEDLGMAVAEYGVSIKRGEFYR